LDLRGKKWHEVGEDCFTKYYRDQFKNKSWVGHVASMGQMRNALSENLKGRNYWENLGTDGKII
jgi:hypothetical protein